MRISPEGFHVEIPSVRYEDSVCGIWSGRNSLNVSRDVNAYFIQKLKMLHRVNHLKYNVRDEIMYDVGLKTTLI